MIDVHYWPTPNGHKVTIFLEEAGLHAQAFGDHLFDKMCSVVHFINGCAFS